MNLGPIRQIAYVSRDLGRTIDHFVRAWNIGPWFRIDHYPLKRATYRGREIELDLSVGLANSGPIQFEIIQQNNDGPSIYTEFLRDVPGLHAQHLALWPTDFDACRSAAMARGFGEVQEGLSNTGPFAYFTHRDEPGQMLEISTLTPAKEKIFGAIRAAAESWDGRDPVRMGLPG
jgi:hypothetical protein